MTTRPRPWTATEDDYLRRNYRRHGGPACARRLGRSPRAVGMRACKIGISRQAAGRWSEGEIDFLRRNAARMSHAEIAAALGRGLPAVNSRACKLGIPTGRRVPWTHRELQTLRDCYGAITNDELARRHFPGRDGRAVGEKARRLGLTKARRFRADPSTLERLRDLVLDGHTDEEVAVILGTNDVTARKYRRSMGLPHNGYGERVREKLRRATREQVVAAGCKSLVELRWLARRVREAREETTQGSGAR
jgi:hypothetical protein